MCGRFGLESPELSETRFDARRLPGLDEAAVMVPRYNIAPTQGVLTIAPSKRLDGARAVKSMRWGLVAEWALNDARKPRPINIKSEGILDRPAYRRLLARKRCIIVGDGFYEWEKLGARKQPWNIGLRGGELFGFAGVWDACKQKDAWLVSCAILTTRPNEVVADIHDRMPVILRPEHEALWLDQETTEAELLTLCLEPLPASLMDRYPVPALVNGVSNEGPALRQRIDSSASAQPSLL